MLNPQEKPAPFTAPYSPIAKPEKEGVDDYPDWSPPCGCGCFRLLCFIWDEGASHNYLLQERGGGGVHEDTWLVAKLKTLKQLSELVAGPKWKNFIRKIGKFCNYKKYGKQTAAKFQYSPESYALNFAGDQDLEEDGNLLHSFSSRFASHALINDQKRKWLVITDFGILDGAKSS